MKNENSNMLLNSYMKAKNYKRDKSIAVNMNVYNSTISKIRTGRRCLTEQEAMFLANGANIDPGKALLLVYIDRVDDELTKTTLNSVIKRLN